MATVPAVQVGPDAFGKVIVTWETLTDGDQGEPVSLAGYPEKTVHSDGSYSGTAVITMQGSNNKVAWFTLTDHAGTDVTMGADTAGAVIAESPLWIRPSVGAGDASTDIDVVMVAGPRHT